MSKLVLSKNDGGNPRRVSNGPPNQRQDSARSTSIPCNRFHTNCTRVHIIWEFFYSKGVRSTPGLRGIVGSGGSLQPDLSASVTSTYLASAAWVSIRRLWRLLLKYTGLVVLPSTAACPHHMNDRESIRTMKGYCQTLTSGIMGCSPGLASFVVFSRSFQERHVWGQICVVA
jgi:hypothetical protein